MIWLKNLSIDRFRKSGLKSYNWAAKNYRLKLSRNLRIIIKSLINNKIFNIIVFKDIDEIAKVVLIRNSKI